MQEHLPCTATHKTPVASCSDVLRVRLSVSVLQPSGLVYKQLVTFRRPNWEDRSLAAPSRGPSASSISKEMTGTPAGKVSRCRLPSTGGWLGPSDCTTGCWDAGLLRGCCAQSRRSSSVGLLAVQEEREPVPCGSASAELDATACAAATQAGFVSLLREDLTVA